MPLQLGADCLHMVQLMPLPSQNPIICCVIYIQTGFTCLVPASPKRLTRYLKSSITSRPGQGTSVRACVRACVCVCVPVDNFTQNRTVGESPTLYPVFILTSLK